MFNEEQKNKINNNNYKNVQDLYCKSFKGLCFVLIHYNNPSH